MSEHDGRCDAPNHSNVWQCSHGKLWSTKRCPIFRQTPILKQINHWLVVWNMFFFPYVGKNNPHWLSCFSEGLKPPTRSCYNVESFWSMCTDLTATSLEWGESSANVCRPESEWSGGPVSDWWINHCVSTLTKQWDIYVMYSSHLY